MVEYVLPQRVEIRLGRVKPDRLADLLEQVGQVKGEREYVIQMRVRDDDRTNPELLLPTQADRERAGVDRQRVVDQIGRQQLDPPIRRAWDNPEFHYCTWERNGAIARLSLRAVASFGFCINADRNQRSISA